MYYDAEEMKRWLISRHDVGMHVSVSVCADLCDYYQVVSEFSSSFHLFLVST